MGQRSVLRGQGTDATVARPAPDLIIVSIICNVIRHVSGAAPPRAWVEARPSYLPMASGPPPSRDETGRGRMVDEPAADDALRAFFTERSQQPGDVPLTAEDFARMAGELEIAYRLAWLKRQTSSLAPYKRDRPSPR